VKKTVTDLCFGDVSVVTAHRKETEQRIGLSCTLPLTRHEEARNFDVPQVLREQYNKKRRPVNTTTPRNSATEYFQWNLI